ncbi:hypothetical protein OROMI_017417 [Orobanche minor]
MSMMMYKVWWDFMKTDFMRFMEEFHRNGKLYNGLNKSFITLIPKAEGGTELKNFRPISLIGGRYKILAKVLMGRLRRVMSTIISENQSAFVEGRQILDCIVSLNETIEILKTRRSGGFVYKIDFEKAYDSVRWDFLLHMMGNLNFDRRWIRWMKECVSTASASVLVNGVPSGVFRLGRGLRQGDPRRAVELKLYDPVDIGDEDAGLSHLQFADDTVFMGEANIKNVVFFRRFLILIEVLTGLRINVDKCQLFGIKASPGVVEDMATILRSKVGRVPFNYLGVKVGCSHKRARDWSYVVDKVRSKLRKWDVKKLSFSGRATLVKSVLEDRCWVKGWWGSVLSSLEDNGGKWFWDSVSIRVGDGQNTLFWGDVWAGGCLLKSMFERLFRLSRQQELHIANIGSWNGNDWCWEWDWNRSLRDRDMSQLHNLCDYIDRYKIKKGTKDTWIWKHSPDGCYSVNIGYNTILTREHGEAGVQAALFKKIWNSGAIHKANGGLEGNSKRFAD